jgi:hypothetical protein
MTSSTRSDLARWTAEAAALPDDVTRPALPIHVITEEALTVANFTAKYWLPVKDPETKSVTRPGLKLAVRRPRAGAPAATSTTVPDLHAKTPDDLRSLQRALLAAQADYLKAIDRARDAPLFDRAAFLLREITGVLEYLFDDGVEDERDAQLTRVRRAHPGDDGSSAAVALALDDFASLAGDYRDEVDGLGGFDVALIDEAPGVAQQLRQTPERTTGPDGEPTGTALDRRNRLAALLVLRLARVRSAARWVFRDHPEIVREATSAYARRQRAEARRAQKKATETPDAPAAPSGDSPPKS